MTNPPSPAALAALLEKAREHTISLLRGSIQCHPASVALIEQLADALAASSAIPSPTPEEMALRNCHMLARRMIHRGQTDGWEHIVRFCESAGITSSLLREAAIPSPTPDPPIECSCGGIHDPNATCSAYAPTGAAPPKCRLCGCESDAAVPENGRLCAACASQST